MLAVAIGFGGLALWAQPVVGQSATATTSSTMTLTLIIPPRRGQFTPNQTCPVSTAGAVQCRVGERVLQNVVVTDVVEPNSAPIRIISAE